MASLGNFYYGLCRFRDRLKDLQIALLSSGGLVRRRHPSQHEETVRQFGVELFTSLLVRYGVVMMCVRNRHINEAKIYA